MAASNRTIFDQILEEARLEGYTDVRTRAARVWLRERARDVPEVSEETLIDSTETKLHPSVNIGHMYLFIYDPKTKEKLPYYDTFPLVIPTEFTSDGFKGLNLHYLPHGHRAVLMDRMYAFITNPNLDPGTKLALTYSSLATLTSYSSFRPCYKRYLFAYARSRYLLIDPKEWEIALFLPLERFQKASANRIYNDSLGKIRHRKRKLL